MLESVVTDAGSGPVLGTRVAGLEEGFGTKTPASAPVDGVDSGVSIVSTVLVVMEVGDEGDSDSFWVDPRNAVK